MTEQRAVPTPRPMGYSRAPRKLVFGALPCAWCVLALAACPKPGVPPGEQLASECSDRAAQARQKVLAVVDAFGTCQTDDDCAVVAVGSGCFDGCTRAVNTRGVEALGRVVGEVDQADCRTFRADGCVLEHPPCAPPAPAACKDGRCQ